MINTRADYEKAIKRADELRAQGKTAKTSRELAELEGAIARYVAKPGEPARRKARPDNGDADTM